MHIVDISALYSPRGGGIRTYVDRKLLIAETLGHRLTIIVPGPEAAIRQFGSAQLITVPSPRFPLDRRYSYFESDAVIHALLDEHEPDFIEASSPWGSASAVADWRPGTVPRALVMHADPLSAWAYRWLENVVSRQTIDRGFDWFWRHLRRLDDGFDLVVSASPSLTERLRSGGMAKVQTIPMGVEPDLFSPALRDPALRARLLDRCDLPETATLLLGVGRLSPEKRWPMVIAGVVAAGYSRPLGLLIIGDGYGRAAVARAVGENPHIRLLAPTADRPELARILASADLLIHGSPAETFGMVPAEARASGLPIVVPDEGGAGDQALDGAGIVYVSGDAASAASAIGEAVDQLAPLRARALRAAGGVRTMDEHFAELFAQYAAMRAAPPSTSAFPFNQIGHPG